MTGGAPDESKAPPRWRRALPLAVLAAGFAAFFALGLDDYLGFDGLRQNRLLLTDWVAREGAWAIVVFIGTYAAFTACSVPGAVFFTIASGFLFGYAWGTLWSLTGATIGATIIFLAARTALGDLFRARAGPTLRKLEAGFSRNAFNYLLVLRLVPLFPFWIINLAAAFLGVPLGTYVAATALGMIPAAFAFTFFGAGIGTILDSEQAPTLAGVMTPEIMIALGALAALSILPVLYRYLTGRKSSREQD